jgi:hypothetical protein
LSRQKEPEYHEPPRRVESGGVGYCRPPREHQFKPGQSGNPRGRPKGSRNRATIINQGPTPPRLKRPAHLIPVDPTLELEAELRHLSTASAVGLQRRYRTLFRTEPPAAFDPDLLRRSIAYRIQEKVYGGLPSDSRRLLSEMVKAAASKSVVSQELSRRIKAGCELVGIWKGRTCRVTVLKDGFAYEGKNFSSLSEITNSITGARCDGPQFFGLTERVKGGGKDHAD